jgi:hypothetical protein
VSYKVVALIAAMHTAGGETFRGAAGWLSLAQQHHQLLEEFREVFGKHLPTPIKLGFWLLEHSGEKPGTAPDEPTIHAKHSEHRKAWLFRVITKRRLEQLAQEAIAAKEKKAAEIQSAFFEKYGRKDLERATRIEARQPSVTIPVQAASELTPPKPTEFLTQTRKDTDGKLHTEIVRDRTGEPMKSAPHTLEPPKPEPVLETPKTRVELMREEYLRRNSGVAGAGGFCDPAGVVSRNMHTEQGGTFVNVCRPLNGNWS